LCSLQLELPLVHQRARLGVEVGIRVGDGNRLSEQLEGTASFTASLTDHGEQIDTFDLVWKLAHELMAQDLGIVVTICEEEVEGTVCEAIDPLFDALVAEVAVIIHRQGCVRHGRMPEGRRRGREVATLLVLLAAAAGAWVVASDVGHSPGSQD